MDSAGAFLQVPPALNRLLVPRCLRASKHVYAQKPIEVTLEATNQLLAEAADLGANTPGRPLLMISEHAQWLPEVLELQAQLEAGAIGTVSSLPRWRLPATDAEPCPCQQLPAAAY